MSSLAIAFDEVMANTIGVLWRGYSFTGQPDPWTQDLLKQQEAAGIVKAGGNPDLAAQYAQQDIPAAIQSSPGTTPSLLQDPTAAISGWIGGAGSALGIGSGVAGTKQRTKELATVDWAKYIEVAVVILVAILLIQVL